MKSHRRVIAPLACLAASTALLAIYSTASATHRSPSAPNRSRRAALVHVARGWFRGCDAAGWGGDLALNRQKNRGTAPRRYLPMQVAEINALPELPPAGVALLPAAALRLPAAPRYRPALPRERSRWTPQERRALRRWEARGVVVRGYLIAANRERFEAGNCYRPDLYDEHFWLVQRRGEGKAQGLIAEITPRWRAARPGWTLGYLRRLARRQARVEIRGWLLLDQAHPGQVGKTRAGLWEVHPVTGLTALPRKNPAQGLLTAGNRKARAANVKAFAPGRQRR